MRPLLRVLLPGTLALIFTGLVPETAHSQNWDRSFGHNPAYAFYWHNYMYNYAPANYFPGGYWYNTVTSPYLAGAGYWWYSPHRGYYWRYPYGYSPSYVYAVPYYVPVPDPYPVIPSKPPSAKSSEKEVAKKEPVEKPAPSPPEPKPPLTSEEIKRQEEHDSARQLKLAKKLLEAAVEDERTGKEGNASNLREFANEHFAEIAKRYPATPAGKEAQQLLEKEISP